MQLATAVNYAGLGTFIKALVGIARCLDRSTSFSGQSRNQEVKFTL